MSLPLLVNHDERPTTKGTQVVEGPWEPPSAGTPPLLVVPVWEERPEEDQVVPTLESIQVVEVLIEARATIPFHKREHLPRTRRDILSFASPLDKAEFRQLHQRF